MPVRREYPLPQSTPPVLLETGAFWVAFRMISLRATAAAVAACIMVNGAACLFDEHISTTGVPQLERIAVYLDRDESPTTTTGLQSLCAELEVWASDAGRDGDIVMDICERAFAHHDWSGARKMMLDAFPYRERQEHLNR